MLLENFYKRGSHFLCRFCGKELGTFRTPNSLVHNNDYRRVQVALSTGQLYRLNGCSDCLTKDIDYELIQAALDADPSTPPKGHATVIPGSMIIMKRELV